MTNEAKALIEAYRRRLREIWPNVQRRLETNVGIPDKLSDVEELLAKSDYSQASGVDVNDALVILKTIGDLSESTPATSQ